MTGFPTLLHKEVLRFWKVAFQTVAAPVLSALLYLVVFSHALAAHVQAFPGVSYVQFLVPGLAMMSMLQNAFANSSSSLIQSKITGNIVFILLPPMAAGEIFAAYLLASMVRGVVVGMGVFAATLWIIPLPVPNVLWVAAFSLVGCGLLWSVILLLILSVWFPKLGWLILPVVAVFLALQFLRWFLPPKNPTSNRQ